MSDSGSASSDSWLPFYTTRSRNGGPPPSPRTTRSNSRAAQGRGGGGPSNAQLNRGLHDTLKPVAPEPEDSVVSGEAELTALAEEAPEAEESVSSAEAEMTALAEEAELESLEDYEDEEVQRPEEVGDQAREEVEVKKEGSGGTGGLALSTTSTLTSDGRLVAQTPTATPSPAKGKRVAFSTKSPLRRDADQTPERKQILSALNKMAPVPSLKNGAWTPEHGGSIRNNIDALRQIADPSYFPLPNSEDETSGDEEEGQEEPEDTASDDSTLSGPRNRKRRRSEKEEDEVQATETANNQRPLKKIKSHAVKIPFVKSLPELNPQPIQWSYAPHPVSDRSDAWFIEMFKRLYRQAERLSAHYFAIHNTDQGQFFDPWDGGAVGKSSEFVRWAETVAEPDLGGGWDALLRNREKRKWLVMGVIMRVLKVRVFDAELWGASEEDVKLLGQIDESLAFSQEGFARQQLRAETVRTIMRRQAVTPRFYQSTAELTAQIALLLHPLTKYLYSLPVGRHYSKPLPTMNDLYQSIHNLVSNAAYLSLAVRLSPTIFYWVETSPGSTYDEDDHHSLAHDMYQDSEKAIVDKYRHDLTAWRKIDKSLAKQLRALQRARGYIPPDLPGRTTTLATVPVSDSSAATTSIPPAEQDIITKQGLHRLAEAVNPHHTHRALVHISVWPVITRFKAGSDADDAAERSAPKKDLADKDGMRILQISKAAVIFHFGVENEGPPGRVGLRQWARLTGEQRAHWGVGESERERGEAGSWLDFWGRATALGLVSVVGLKSGWDHQEAILAAGLEAVSRIAALWPGA